jgi:uncharacterized protein (DUF983 family)
MDLWIKRNAAISALTQAQVNTAIQRHFKPGSLMTITAGIRRRCEEDVTQLGDPRIYSGFARARSTRAQAHVDISSMRAHDWPVSGPCSVIGTHSMALETRCQKVSHGPPGR